MQSYCPQCNDLVEHSGDHWTHVDHPTMGPYHVFDFWCPTCRGEGWSAEYLIGHEEDLDDQFLDTYEPRD